MIEYLVLGVGVFLVMISLLYTLIAGRRSKRRQFDELRHFSTSEPRYGSQFNKLDQVKESIINLDEELDELVGELWNKENEIKQIIHRVKGWNNEISTSGFEKELKNRVALTTEEEQKEKYPYPPEPISQKPVSIPHTFSKYDKIKGLADQGFSIEEIARQLNMGYREVELVVKLRQKGASEGA
ncbi:MAG: hypothetical protein KAX49_00700 [Halanaerobiales bacterium]|nr:hypothetical protein [Halanaerobiales bacterium]